MNIFDQYNELQRRRASGDDGFTLIELLIVIVVMGILAAVVVFALGGVTGQSAQSACNADSKSVETAIAAYQTQNATITYTSTISSLDATTKGQALVNTDLVSNYLHTWPNSTHYVIAANGAVATGTGNWTWTANGDVLAGPAGNQSSYDSQTSSPASACYMVK